MSGRLEVGGVELRSDFMRRRQGDITRLVRMARELAVEEHLAIKSFHEHVHPFDMSHPLPRTVS